jgi:hypothetical protein
MSILYNLTQLPILQPHALNAGPPNRHTRSIHTQHWISSVFRALILPLFAPFEARNRNFLTLPTKTHYNVTNLL